MSQFDYDLFVIGAGSGGVRASRMAAGFGARVAVAEDRYMGGTCVNVGCVPKKLFVYGSEYMQHLNEGAGFGVFVAGKTFSWETLRDNKTREIERLNGIYNNLLNNSGVELISGRATLIGPNEVEVAGQTFTAKNILIATGGWPFVPDIPGKEHMITSNEVFYLDEFPEKALVLGAGYIAVEFAGIFNGLGAETELVFRGEQMLRGFDEEVREFVSDEIAKKGVKVTAQDNVVSIEKLPNGQLKAALQSGEERVVDQILCATGRRPNVAGLGLESAGVELNDAGAIAVNDQFQTSVEHIYAIGDVVDRIQLTPVALAEGMFIANRLFGDKDYPELDYENIPTAVFCQPNIGTVGLTEEQARVHCRRLRIYTSSFKPMKHTLSGEDERSLMKLIVDDASDKVVGAHMVGPEAGEIVQGLAIAMKAGATKAHFDSTVGVHPTAAEEFVTLRTVTRH